MTNHAGEPVRFAAGKELLASLDDLGMASESCFWAYYKDLAEWRLYIVTNLVDFWGRKKSYQVLLDSFKAINPSDAISIVDVYLMSPSNPIYRAMRGTLGLYGNSGLYVANMELNGVRMHAYFYRFFDSETAEKQKISARVFERNVKRQLEKMS